MKKIKVSKKITLIATSLILVAILPSCNTAPDPIKIGVDKCQFCKMAISDIRFGTEAITNKGKIFKYDEAHCLISDMKSGEIDAKEIKEIYFTDYCGKHELVNQKNCFMMRSEELRSPMEGNVAAYMQKDSMVYYKNEMGGEEVFWDQLIK